jgi:hypothetical protein
MKLGFLLDFFDFRNDFRKVLGFLAREHEITIFAKEHQLRKIKPKLPPGINIRLIDEERNSLNNRIWRLLFSKFGIIPQSVRNYYLMERFLVYLVNDKLKRLKSLLFFDLSFRLPKWLAYDLYLDKLEYSGKTKIDDIDKFICLTRISDDLFFSRLVRENKKVQVYVYSWDHPCKHKQFSKRVETLVWNEGTRDDLVDLQSIPAEKIAVIGSSQFCYIQEFLHQDLNFVKKPYPFDYIYFGCFAGIPAMIEQEIDIIKQISTVIYRSIPQTKLVVRPYPVLQDWSIYESLKGIPNIVVDDSFKNKDLSTSDSKIMDKFIKIHFAKAFFHLGTTMGLEACFTSTPSFIVDYGYEEKSKSPLNIKHGIHQYQNEKYLIRKGKKNVIDSADYLGQVLRKLDDPKFLDLNKEIAGSFGVISFEIFSERLTAS